MPRYFFNVEGIRRFPDRKGIVLAGPDRAHSAAIVAVGAMAKDLGSRIWTTPAWRMHVTDEQGATVCAIVIEGTSGDRH